MSFKIGTVERCRGMDVDILTDDGGALPVTFTPGATVNLKLLASSAGVELIALPCTLTVDQAEELAQLLDVAILKAGELGRGAHMLCDPCWKSLGRGNRARAVMRFCAHDKHKQKPFPCCHCGSPTQISRLAEGS